MSAVTQPPTALARRRSRAGWSSLTWRRAATGAATPMPHDLTVSKSAATVSCFAAGSTAWQIGGQGCGRLSVGRRLGRRRSARPCHSSWWAARCLGTAALAWVRADRDVPRDRGHIRVGGRLGGRPRRCRRRGGRGRRRRERVRQRRQWLSTVGGRHGRVHFMLLSRVRSGELHQHRPPRTRTAVPRRVLADVATSSRPHLDGRANSRRAAPSLPVRVPRTAGAAELLGRLLPALANLPAVDHHVLQVGHPSMRREPKANRSRRMALLSGSGVRRLAPPPSG